MIKTYVLSAQHAHMVHFVFEWLAILVGVQVYRMVKKKRVGAAKAGITTGTNFTIAIGCILGAGIGNKLVFLAEMPQVINQYGWVSLAMGQSIVGGFVGGLIGVEVAKKLSGVTESTGDDFVLPLVVGILIGRTGCFLAGLHDGTYGVETALPWGMDFGDGISRHPTQLYDMLWAVVMFGLLTKYKATLTQVAGLSFKLFLAGYLAWRFLVDGIKPVPYEYWFGWSGIQWVCVLSLVCYLPFVWKDIKQLYGKK